MPVAERDSDIAIIAPDAVPELAILVGRNLRRLRTRQGYSLERLAKVSGLRWTTNGSCMTPQSPSSIRRQRDARQQG